MSPQLDADELADVMGAAWMGTGRMPVEEIGQGVASASDALTDASVPALVRLAYGEASDAATSWLAEQLSDSDGSDDRSPWLADDQPLREQLTAAAVLIALLKGSVGSQVDLAALIVTSLAFVGRAPAHPSIPERAARHLKYAREQNGSLPDRPKPPGRAASTKEAIEATTTADWAIYRTAITELANELGRVRQALSRYGVWAEECHTPMTEQLELLWWIESDYSMTAGLPLRALPPAAVPIVAATDVASLAARVPGPPAARGLLRHALVACGVEPDAPISVAECVSASQTISDYAPPSNEQAPADFVPILSQFGAEPAAGGMTATALDVAVETLNECYQLKVLPTS